MLLPLKAGPLAFSVAPRSETDTLALPLLLFGGRRARCLCAYPDRQEDAVACGSTLTHPVLPTALQSVVPNPAGVLPSACHVPAGDSDLQEETTHRISSTTVLSLLAQSNLTLQRILHGAVPPSGSSEKGDRKRFQLSSCLNFCLNIIAFGWVVFPMGGQEWSFKAFANMMILKVAGWSKTVDTSLNFWIPSLGEHVQDLILMALPGISSRTPKLLLF